MLSHADVRAASSMAGVAKWVRTLLAGPGPSWQTYASDPVTV